MLDNDNVSSVTTYLTTRISFTSDVWSLSKVLTCAFIKTVSSLVLAALVLETDFSLGGIHRSLPVQKRNLSP